MEKQEQLKDMLNKEDYYSALHELARQHHPVIAQLFPRIKLQIENTRNYEELSLEQVQALREYIDTSANTKSWVAIGVCLGISLFVIAVGAIGLILLVRNRREEAMWTLYFLLAFLLMTPHFILTYEVVFARFEADRGLGLLKHIKNKH